MASALNWFEIPSADFPRAVAFYSAVFDTQLEGVAMGDMQMAMFPYSEGGTGGAVVASAMQQPSSSGTLVYLNANSGMDAMLERIQNAGGAVLMPRTLITEDIGYMAMFTDTEGNTVALHSSN
ncbi:MAG: VOC family protein [Candidatus Kapabacteria bacterium]|nr:VOC family protein [Candidatus Kapabacteria bacterium]